MPAMPEQCPAKTLVPPLVIVEIAGTHLLCGFLDAAPPPEEIIESVPDGVPFKPEDHVDSRDASFSLGLVLARRARFPQLLVGGLKFLGSAPPR